jgi:hypothetical protein
MYEDSAIVNQADGTASFLQADGRAASKYILNLLRNQDIH